MLKFSASDKEKAYRLFLHPHIDGYYRAIENANTLSLLALQALVQNNQNSHKSYDEFIVSFSKSDENKHIIREGELFDEEVIYEENIPKSFQEMCRLAGMQSGGYGAHAKIGFTRSLGMILDAVKNGFENIELSDKKGHGLGQKSAAEITHFDLLEIGLFGKVSTNISASETFLRNQNLIHLYSNKLRPKHIDSFLPDKIAGNNIKLSASDLTAHLIKWSVDESEIGKVNFNQVVQSENADDIFIAKIQKVLDECRAGFGFFHPLSWQSSASKKLCNKLDRALQGKTSVDKVKSVVVALSNAQLPDGRLMKALKTVGFLDQAGAFVLSAAKNSDTLKI